uniref:WD repeat domain 21 n=1 Tax=Mastacembelus armatus TaxID=205130 RepID=A0A7N8XNX1_9TELE
MKKWDCREGQRSHRRQEWHRATRQRSTRNRQWHGHGEADPSYRPSQSQRRRDNESASSSSSYSSSSSSSSSPPSTSKTSSAAPELPGFYFDPEKNRYFRLLPGHNNCNPLTKEQLQEKEREKQRNKMLEQDEKSSNVGLLWEKSTPAFSVMIHEVKVSGMRRHKLEIQSIDNSNPNTDNFRIIVGDSACERVFTVNDVSHGGCKYGIMNFSSSSRGSLSVEMCDNLYFTNRKVNSICWASVNYPDSHVLLCLVGMADTPGCVSLLPSSLFSNSNPDQPGMLCSFKISTAWSCAWCLNPQFDKTFSTGLSRRVIMKDAETGRTQTYSVSSDVLAQRFALRVPVLFNGCRSGEIFSIDLRQRGRRDQSWKASRFRQESAITSIHILQDENYLLAADMLGQIKLWDVRVTKPVQEYKGHYNEHAYLPIHVNEPEGLLLAVGQDCYTRLWSLKDSHLLRTIPSPHPAANDLIPSVVFSSNLGGCRGLPGLLMAVKHDLYYFPYNTDYQEVGEQQAENAANDF